MLQKYRLGLCLSVSQTLISHVLEMTTIRSKDLKKNEVKAIDKIGRQSMLIIISSQFLSKICYIEVFDNISTTVNSPSNFTRNKVDYSARFEQFRTPHARLTPAQFRFAASPLYASRSPVASFNNETGS